MWWLVSYLKSMGDNFGTVSATAKIYRGAKPDKGILRKLRELEVQTILDLRDGPIGDAKEEAERAGFKWIGISMRDDAAPNPIQIRAVLDLLDLGCIFVAC